MLPIFLSGGSDPTCMVPYMLALAGQPSLYFACMVFWVKGEAFCRNSRGKICVRPLFLVFGFFCVVETLLFGGDVHLSGICGLVGPDILVPILLV